MKKSLIVIALALLMIVPVFAAETDTKVASKAAGTNTKFTSSDNAEKKTEVNVTIDLNPKYAFGVTGGASTTKDDGTYAATFTSYGEGDKNIIVAVAPEEGTAGTDYILYDQLKRVTVISMVANEKKMILEAPTTNTYYVSYWFFENNTQNVKLTCSLDGNMKLTEASKTALSTNSGITVTDGDTKAEIPYEITFTSDNTVLKSNATSDAEKTKEIVTAQCKATVGYIEFADVAFTIEPISTANSIKDKYVGTYTANIVLNLTVGA